jgi:hypothetical protein
MALVDPGARVQNESGMLSIEADFAAKVESELNRLIERITSGTAA